MARNTRNRRHQSSEDPSLPADRERSPARECSGTMYHAPQPYDPARDWDAFQDQLTIFFLNKKIVNPEEQRGILLNCLGPVAMESLRAWVGPGKILTTTYDDLTATLKKYYGKVIDKRLARADLRRTKQKLEESDNDYILRMSVLAAQCGYTDDTDAILSITTGLQNSELRDYIFRPENAKDTIPELLALVRAFNVQCRVQQTVRNEQSTQPATIYMATQQRRYSKPAPEICYYCGLQPHPRYQCPAARNTCTVCGKRGHLPTVCHFRNQQPLRQNGHSQLLKHQEHQNFDPGQQFNQPLPSRHAQQIEQIDYHENESENNPYFVNAIPTYEDDDNPYFIHQCEINAPRSQDNEVYAPPDNSDDHSSCSQNPKSPDDALP